MSPRVVGAEPSEPLDGVDPVLYHAAGRDPVPPEVLPRDSIGEAGGLVGGRDSLGRGLEAEQGGCALGLREGLRHV
jgi:hypothetical protein